MKKLCCIALIMLLGVLLTSPTISANPKPTKERARNYTLYIDGQALGDLQANPSTDHSYLFLQFETPDDDIPSSRQVYDRGGCSGGGCNFEPECAKYGPWIWAANAMLHGRIKGDIKVVLHTLSSPGARVEVWLLADIQEATDEGKGTCDPPDATTTVELPPGKAIFETTINGVNFSADTDLYFGVAPILGDPPIFARIDYGAVSALSRIEFTCVPPRGSASCDPFER